MSDRHVTPAPAAHDAATRLRVGNIESAEAFARVGVQLVGAASLLALGLEHTEVDWCSALQIVRCARRELQELQRTPGCSCDEVAAAVGKLAGADSLLADGLDDIEVDWRSALALVRQAQQDLGAVPVDADRIGAVPAAAAIAAEVDDDAVDEDADGDDADDDDAGGEGDGGKSGLAVVSLTRREDRSGYTLDFTADPVILNPASTLHDIIALSAARAEALHNMLSVLSTCGSAGESFEPHQIADLFVGPAEDLLSLLQEAVKRARREEDLRTAGPVAAGAAHGNARGRS